MRKARSSGREASENFIEARGRAGQKSKRRHTETGSLTGYLWKTKTTPWGLTINRRWQQARCAAVPTNGESL